MSEKIKLSNSTEFNLQSMGINEQNNIRHFTISSDLTAEEIATAFSDVNDIQYILEDGSTYTTYTDCISLRTITKNIADNTYTIGIYFNKAEKDNLALQAQIDALTVAQTA